ncbi:hypothetical protein B0H10DRAFT_1949176 [Mycena sp. CBHHK59/15]|nr:hypothetical protein B0H10DRAFT_1949176 [Mycena sp. CBHHK59/15]
MRWRRPVRMKWKDGMESARESMSESFQNRRVLTALTFPIGWDQVPGRNFGKFLPQIKKYSLDAQCPLILLTDYVNTTCLKVKESGTDYNKADRKLMKNDKKAKVLCHERQNPHPHHVLFSIAIMRLIDAGLWSEKVNGGLEFCSN